MRIKKFMIVKIFWGRSVFLKRIPATARYEKMATITTKETFSDTLAKTKFININKVIIEL